MVDGHEFTEDLTLYLFDKTGEGVAVDETAFFGVVGVEVKIETKPVFGYEVVAQLPNCKDSRLSLWARVDVKAVEVLAVGIHAEVPVVNTIHVDHGHHHEHKHLPQQVSPEVLLVSQKIDDSLHGVGSWGLPRMHPCTYQYHLLFEAQRPRLLLRKKLLMKLFLRADVFVLRSDGEKVDGPFLRGVSDDLAPEVEVWVVLEGAESAQV